MSFGNTLRIAALTAALGGLILPAFAQNGSGGMQRAPDQGMHMGQMGQRMMNGRMMSRGMMGGCSEMMQSMNNSEGRPNNQWQKHSPDRSDTGG
jgi:hypothetical protein